MQLHSKKSIANLDQKSWEKSAFDSFSSSINSSSLHFPCTLGVAGFKADQLRYAFIDDAPTALKATESLSGYLSSFLKSAKEFGKNTSLVVFFNESRDLGVTAYKEIFWKVLNGLSHFDLEPWPLHIPESLNSSSWEFCFGGEPIFVVCNTPSHRLRRSRFGTVFTITFQPRWVFDGVVGSNAPNEQRIKEEIHRRLLAFDNIPISPFLGSYGAPGNLEWQQYFLEDSNNTIENNCPFNRTSSIETVSLTSTSITDLGTVVTSLIPNTGSVEIQVDSPFRRHSPHQHLVNETLHIVSGEITFDIGGKIFCCKPGDRLLLPRNTLHASTAGKFGCRYVIATRLVTTLSKASTPLES